MKIEFDEEQEELDFVQYHEKLATVLQTVKPEVLHTYSCKYYLPCGRCDKTGEICTQFIDGVIK